jgi:uncharacterized protein HemX
MQEQTIEQKLKLSASNIIALVAVLISILGGYINVKSQQTEFNQRITTLEKNDEDQKLDKGKFDFKLDKIIESVNQIKVDMAEQRSQKN